jgi:integrase
VVKPRKGDRALDLDELAAVWLAAEHLSAPTCAAVRLLMLLGQRCGEVDEMRRSELIEAKNLDHRLISADERRALIKAGASLCFVLPVARQKTRWKVEDPKPHIVPLPPQAIAIIDTQPKYSGGDYLFSHTTGRKPFGNWTEIRAALYEHAALKTPWTPRDLRASLVTGFANLLETPTGTAGKLCNHSPGKADGITGKIYERSRRLAIVYRATCRWADAISAAVADYAARRSGANVFSLPV